MVKQPFACGECNRILPDPEKKNDPAQCIHRRKRTTPRSAFIAQVPP